MGRAHAESHSLKRGNPGNGWGGHRGRFDRGQAWPGDPRVGKAGVERVDAVAVGGIRDDELLRHLTRCYPIMERW